MTDYPAQDQQGPWGAQLVAAITERIAVPQATANAAQTDATQALADAASAQAAAGAKPSLTSSAASTSAVGASASAGVATTAAKADHVHGREAFGAVTAQTSYGSSSGNGAATTVARSDHTHGTPALPTPAAIGASATTHTHGTPRATFVRTTAVALTTATPASFNWSSVTTADGGPTYPGGPIAELPAYNGAWLIHATAVFAAGAGGSRTFKLYRAADDVLVLQGGVPGSATSEESIVTAMASYSGSASEGFYALLEQTSGGSLNATSVTLSFSLLART